MIYSCEETKSKLPRHVFLSDKADLTLSIVHYVWHWLRNLGLLIVEYFLIHLHLNSLRYHDGICREYIPHRSVDMRILIINVDSIDETNYCANDNHRTNYLTIDRFSVMMMLKIDDSSMYVVNPCNSMKMPKVRHDQDRNNEYLDWF